MEIALEENLFSRHGSLWITIEDSSWTPKIQNPAYLTDGSSSTLPKYIPKTREDSTKDYLVHINIDSLTLKEIFSIMGKSIFPEVINHTDSGKEF